jgi:hypothetical protein
MSTNSYSRDNQLLNTIRHKGKIFKTSVGSAAYENLYCGMKAVNSFPLLTGFIPNGYQHRPDLISNVFLSNVSSWWRLCEINSIYDTFEQLNIGDEIYIPGVR